jgi:hypothetical protein
LGYLNLGHFYAKYGGWKDFEEKMDEIMKTGSADVALNLEWLELANRYFDTASRLDPNLVDICKSLSEGINNLIRIIKGEHAT